MQLLALDRACYRRMLGGTGLQAVQDQLGLVLRPLAQVVQVISVSAKFGRLGA